MFPSAPEGNNFKERSFDGGTGKDREPSRVRFGTKMEGWKELRARAEYRPGFSSAGPPPSPHPSLMFSHSGVSRDRGNL